MRPPRSHTRWSPGVESYGISAPLFFVAVGIVVGSHVLDVESIEATHGTAFHVGELALALLLFSDAASVDLQALRGGASLPGRLLGIGVRKALNVESGLNDGLSVPFLALFIAFAGEETLPAARDWLQFALEQIGLGTLIGVVVGGGGAWIVERASERGLMTDVFEPFAALSLAVLAFLLADEAGGNGFIAAFTGGLAAGRMGKVCGRHVFAFTEEEGQLLSFAVFFIFSLTSIEFLEDADWRMALYAALSLTLVRMLPVALATAGMGFRKSSILFMGWFGPRGLASIILALVVAEEVPELPGLGAILATVTMTVLASVVLHGLSAPLLTRA